MAQLPPFERITLDIRKLRDYCLNSAHPRGRHKARVFRDALAIRAAQAEWLRDELLQEIGKSEAAQWAPICMVVAGELMSRPRDRRGAP